MIFSLTLKQQKIVDAWMDSLPDAYTGAVGGRFTYSWTPTSIGDLISVKDAITGQELDLTNLG